MRYGYFAENMKEYIITRPDTPSPWINYISNLRGYCGIVSQTGGGFSFHGDPRDRRITKYRYNNVPVDRPGRYFYLKNEADGDYWSPTWQPVMRKMEGYECRHGLGYTVITSEYAGFSHEVLYLVPPDDDCEIWRLTVKNHTGKTQRLSVYSYAEFTMWCEPESRNIQWSLHLTKGSFQRDMIIYDFIEPHPAFDMKANQHYVGDRPGFAFMGLNIPVLDYECVRDKFLGTYNSESNPDGVVNGTLSNSTLRGGVGCGALRGVIELKPGEIKEVVVVLGFGEKIEVAEALKNKLSGQGVVDTELEKVKNTWDHYLSTFTLESEDRELNTVVNVWNQYQCKTTFDWSRYISFYENGEGRGMGTRDSCQDTLAVGAQLPDRVKQRIHQIVSTCQFETGDTYHQFFPLGHKGDLKGFSDDHLWIPQMVYAYMAETGDTGILKESARYADSDKSADIYTHMVDALNYTARMIGPHGLPLILTADWNDTLHLWMECDRPESVLTGELYVYALKLMAEMAEIYGKPNDAGEFLTRAAEMTRLINDQCWDGEWYLRGFGSEVIGSRQNDAAKIFLNSQVWAVISGVAGPDRALQCMDSVRKYLFCDEGVKKVWPPFAKYDQTYGLISRYNAGRKENGIFAHTNAWVVVAESILNRPEYAYEYYRTILPLRRNERAEVMKTEPYVFCQTLCSNDAQDKGEGANSWLTGTASWMYVAATQYLLGIKPVLEGLQINPLLPPDWDGFKVHRVFQGCAYDIRVNRGKEEYMKVDGEKVIGNVITPEKGKRQSVIEVSVV